MFRVLIGVILFLPLCAEERVALITGASRGVGRATAEYLVEKGFTVYGTVRSPVMTNKPDLHFIFVDFNDQSSIESAVRSILEKEGRIDLLINNAATAVVGPIELLTDQEMHDQMEVNFFAPIRFTQAVLPIMRIQKRGHIINISSTNGIHTCPYGSLYSASKAALESLSEALAVEVRPYNIHVSIVEPGLITTRLSINMATKDVPNHPYQPIMDAIKIELQDRFAHPELLSPSQTAEEIAAFLYSVIQDTPPKLRYQTSEAAKNDISFKLLDLTGEKYLEKQR